MIDLAHAYQRTAELLGTFGLPTAPYSVNVEVWNLRGSGGEAVMPRVSFNIVVQVAPHSSIGAFAKATPEEALTELERMLRSRGTVAPATAATDDLRVATP